MNTEYYQFSRSAWFELQRTSSGYYELKTQWYGYTYNNTFSTKQAALEEMLSYFKTNSLDN